MHACPLSYRKLQRNKETTELLESEVLKFVLESYARHYVLSEVVCFYSC